TGVEHALPPLLDERDTRLLKAFRQRFDRLADAMTRLSLERLCERIVSEHDYDLAVLAQWDGRRRFANVRKLARLARSYEELRGADLEGFVRFVRAQEAVGAKELEAVAEEEGAGAVRLLTIHAAKGLEFRVVVVADAGREKAGPDASEEYLALSDAERKRERAAEDEERLRLYYVAMTRAIDRLIVSGAVGDGRETPIRWILGRLDCEAELHDAGEQFELERGEATFLIRADRRQPDALDVGDEAQSLLIPAEDGQLALFGELPQAPGVRGYRLPELVPVPQPPLHRVRRLSYSALALYERCSYRYYAERVAGLREERGTAPGGGGLKATEVGDAVHRLLEVVDLASPAPPNLDVVRTCYPAVTDE